MKAKFTLIGITVLFVIGILAAQSYAKVDPKTCVGMWMFDEGKGDTTADSSGNKNDGTLKGPKWINGKFGKALDFGGANDYVVIPNGATVLEQQFTQMSIMAWVYPTANGGGSYGPTVIARTDGDGWSMRINNGQLLADLRLSVTSVTAPIPPTQVTLNAWNHIAITYNSSTGIITGYINGNNIGTLKGNGTLKNAGNAKTCTFIGTDPAGCTPQGAEFDFSGNIDEMAVFNTALTENDIKSIMNDGLVVALGSVTAVHPSGKLTATWADIKTR